MLEIYYEGTPSFANGGVRLALISDTPGIIRFTDAEVVNGGRWTAATAAEVTDDRVGILEGFSILTPGLPSDKSIFARVPFSILGPGITNLTLAPSGLDPLFDGELGDVSGTTALGSLRVVIFPEPSCFALLGLVAVAASCRRHLR